MTEGASSPHHLLRGPLRWALALLIGLTLVIAPPVAGVAEASFATSVASAGHSAAIKAKKKRKKKKRKKRRKKKKKRKKRRKKKKRRAKAEPPPPPLQPAVLLPFEGEEDLSDLATFIAQASSALDGVAGPEVLGALQAHEPLYSTEGVKAALEVAQASHMVRGAVRQRQNHVEVYVAIHSRDGEARFLEHYVTTSGELDYSLIAPLIAEDIDEILPEVGEFEVLAPEAIGFEAAAAMAGADPAETTELGGDVSADADVDVDAAARREVASVQVGAALLYWSYNLESEAMSNAVRWHPLDPSYGVSVAAGLWPHELIGAELCFDIGVRSFGASFPNLLPRLDLTTMAFSGRLLGRYLLPLGLGAGVHVGYRFQGNIVNPKLASTVFPAYGAHLLSPGVDLYVGILRPWLDLRLAGDLIPWGIYSQASEPRPSGGPPGLWGWRAEATLRSELPLHLLAELRLYYEGSYVTFESSSLAPQTERPYGEVQIGNSLRGVSLGLGWSF